MCFLSRETFARSDILKRHSTKCAIRGGNPTSASHLSRPQVCVNKNVAARRQKPVGKGGGVNHVDGMGYSNEITNNTANINPQLANRATPQTGCGRGVVGIVDWVGPWRRSGS
ncbi:hypothetical protein N657DRAFT_244162 [Parathielavia appendiculata]|uniref:Uncharacterized protein n=1 Tax=Parathielavia appendiculata TaxID=2587402 RepID=A0AAN6TSH1_9PEZI|nr:hypothetical protein N657DRAFT_244162 [Parathielavia appendiculata]